MKGACGAEVETFKRDQGLFGFKCPKRPNVTIYGFQSTVEDSLEEACKECQKRGYDKR